MVPSLDPPPHYTTDLHTLHTPITWHVPITRFDHHFCPTLLLLQFSHHRSRERNAPCHKKSKKELRRFDKCGKCGGPTYIYTLTLWAIAQPACLPLTGEKINKYRQARKKILGDVAFSVLFRNPHYLRFILCVCSYVEPLLFCFTIFD